MRLTWGRMIASAWGVSGDLVVFEGIVRKGGPLKQNLAEEEAMAKWIEGNLASLTIEFASRAEAGETAKK